MTPLGLDDLEMAGFAAQYHGHDEVAVRLATRVHHEALAAEDHVRAARMAFWLGMAFANRGDMTQGGGWLARAAGLLELAWPAMDGQFQAAAWLGWARALPDELVRARPVLGVAYAWALLNGGQLEIAEARLSEAERWLDLTHGLLMTNEFVFID